MLKEISEEGESETVRLLLLLNNRKKDSSAHARSQGHTCGVCHLRVFVKIFLVFFLQICYNRSMTVIMSNYILQQAAGMRRERDVSCTSRVKEGIETQDILRRMYLDECTG